MQGLLKLIAFFIPTQAVIRWTKQQLFLPTYHTIQGNYPLPHIHHLYPPKTAQQFEKDLDFLLKHYQPISLETLYDFVFENKALPKNSFFLSFDDGLREVYEFAFPILKRKGIPATIFLNSAFVDNKDLFFRYKASLLIEKIRTQNVSKNQLQTVEDVLSKNQLSQKSIPQKLLAIPFHQKYLLDDIAKILEFDFQIFLKTQKPYLSSEQINELHNNAFTFGAHSVNHPWYGELTEDEQLMQTKDSLDFVQQNFEPNHRVFAFPFHDQDVSDSFFEKIKNNTIAELTFGASLFPQRERTTHFQRFPMEGNRLPVEALFKLKSLYYFAKNRNKSFDV